MRSTPFDVAGNSYLVELECYLSRYSSEVYGYVSFTITIAGDCFSTEMIAPVLPPLTIDSTYVPTTILAFGDTYSGTTSPPTCGPRVCFSTSPNIVWDNDSQLFTVQATQYDVPGTSYLVTLLCGL